MTKLYFIANADPMTILTDAKYPTGLYRIRANQVPNSTQWVGSLYLNEPEMLARLRSETSLALLPTIHSGKGIGSDIAAKLSHVNAKGTEGTYDVAARLCAYHGLHDLDPDFVGVGAA